MVLSADGGAQCAVSPSDVYVSVLDNKKQKVINDASTAEAKRSPKHSSHLYKNGLAGLIKQNYLYDMWAAWKDHSSLSAFILINIQGGNKKHFKSAGEGG